MLRRNPDFIAVSFLVVLIVSVSALVEFSRLAVLNFSGQRHQRLEHKVEFIGQRIERHADRVAQHAESMAKRMEQVAEQHARRAERIGKVWE